MRLHRQLLLVSLFVLSLPWAGCQYIRQVEQVLRDGQLKALEATARAVAAHLEGQAALIDLPEHPAIYIPEYQTYLHPLRSHAIVDGYDVEWRGPGLRGQHYALSESGLALTAMGGIYEDNIYLFFTIEDPTLDHHRPGELHSGDRLILRTLAEDQAVRKYIFRSGGTGTITARYRNESQAVRQEHRIRGEWRESDGGYALELSLPRSLAPRGFDFHYRDASTPAQATLGSYNPVDYPAPWVTTHVLLEDILAPYSSDSLRISILNPHHWLLAQTGNLQQEPDEEAETETAGLDWLYRLILGRDTFPTLDEARWTGRLDSAEVEQALQGEPARDWYQQGSQRVGRVVLPIRAQGRVAGAVVVEESSDALLAETNLAFRGLLLYTLLATGLATLALLSYASWLSWRIRRLKKAADLAVGEDGKIKPELMQSRAGDEIGDLARGYGQLLTRLKDYTDYLRSLSNKLSHELRTPLAVMKSSLENLDHERAGEEASTYIQRAREASQRLSNILNAMSSASRVEESIHQAQREEVELNRLLEDLVQAYSHTYPEADIRLEIEPSTLGYSLNVAPDLIVQMLDKLVDNALDFCPPEGQITLSLARDRQQLTLAVSNTGPLLPEHMQGQLFDSLVSVRSGAGGNGKSHLGLGLYIVRLIVDFHGGQVRATNLADGSGVSFIISLPVR